MSDNAVPRFYFPCIRCHGAISSYNVISHIPTGGTNRVVFECINDDEQGEPCGMRIVTEVTDFQLAILVMDHQEAGLEFPTEGKIHAEEEAQEEDAPDWRGVLSPEEIGKQVQGMRIELDVIETVADIMPLWAYQERVAPETVKREVLRA